VEHGAPREENLRLFGIEQEKPALAGGDANPSARRMISPRPGGGCGFGVEHAPHQDFLIGFEGRMEAHFQARVRPGGEMPHRVAIISSSKVDRMPPWMTSAQPWNSLGSEISVSAAISVSR